MKTEIRLGSIVPHGVGGSEAGAIELIYSFLLTEFEQDYYSRIGINQIGEELSEFVMKEPGKSVHVNIRYPSDNNFENQTPQEKNLKRLEVIHLALLKIAEYGKLDVKKIELIKETIISSKFYFDIPLKKFLNKKEDLSAILTIQPQIDRFDFYISIEKNNIQICKQNIYKGLTTLYYVRDLFSEGKWISASKFRITGKLKNVSIEINPFQCEMEVINLTKYEKAPFFQMMRADISEIEKEKANQDWINSLSTAQADVLKQNINY